MIELKEVKSKKDLKVFVTFPFKLYKDSKYWVPPIISDEIGTFNKTVNPAFETSNAYFYLAYKNKNVVGRIVGIINSDETELQGVKKMRFGWFDTINDIEVTKVLLEKVAEIGRLNNLEFIEGPVGFSSLDKVGALTEGYDHIGTMATWYNYPYYIEHFEKLGFKPEKIYIESKFDFNSIPTERFSRVNDIIKKRFNLTSSNFTKKSEVIPHIDSMFELYNESYKSLTTYVPISVKLQAYFKKKFINFINPEYIKFVFNENDKMIAFAIVLPSFSNALQEIKGKIFPFGFLKLLKAKNHSKTLLFYLIGVHPSYHNKGVTAIIFKDLYDLFKKQGIEKCIRLPELENNLASQQMWKEFDAKVIKRRKTFKKYL
jgi:GNAT superfamily N-acetyltransferase